MFITNNTRSPITAFCWHSERGHGPDTEIQPGQTADVPGPYTESGSLEIRGSIVCQETPDDKKTAFQLVPGRPLHLKEEKGGGVTVRYSSEERTVWKGCGCR